MCVFFKKTYKMHEIVVSSRSHAAQHSALPLVGGHSAGSGEQPLTSQEHLVVRYSLYIMYHTSINVCIAICISTLHVHTYTHLNTNILPTKHPHPGTLPSTPCTSSPTGATTRYVCGGGEQVMNQSTAPSKQQRERRTTHKKARRGIDHHLHPSLPPPPPNSLQMELGEVGEILVEADFLHIPPVAPSPPTGTGHTGDGNTSFGRGSSLRGLLSLATIAPSRAPSSAHTTPRHIEGARPASFEAQYGASVFSTGGGGEVGAS